MKNILVALLLLLGTTLYAQHTIKGEVYDNQNVPIPGVTVALKTSASTATLTDIDGKFSLKINDDLPVTLVFRFLGFRTQEVDVYDADENIKVTLAENINVLNEVVVTALGITREKKSLGYTTQEVKGDELTRNGETSFLNSMSGRVAGVRITNSQGDMGSSRIVIRGETSIAGNNQPLFVVDGIPVDNSQLNSGGATRDFRNAISDLNPEDIESMSVLKGPNAAALYGSRAARGVVLITTKSGKGQKGLGISFNTGVHFATVATLPEFQNVFGQGSNGEFSYVDGKGGGINDGVDESWGPRMDGRLIPQFHSNGEAVPFVPHPNNVRDFFRTGVTYDNALAISGSDTKYDFRLGINHQNQKGVVPNTQINKTNFTINTNYHINKNITVGATANYIITDVPNLPGGPSGNRAAGVMLQFLWFGRQVDMNELANNREINWNNSYYSNPYWRAYYNTTSQKRNRLIGDVHLEAKIIDGLVFNFRSGTDYYNDRRKYRIRYGTNGTPYGSYAEDAYTVVESNTEGILRYKKDLSQDFSLEALVGSNLMNRSEENNYQRAPRLAVPDLYTLLNSIDPLTSTNNLARKRIYSVYSSAVVGYKNYAFLNLTARNDWSSTLPRHNRSYFYPSVSGSLVLSEALDIKSDVLDFLKLRAGWSEVGSDTDPYNIQTVFDLQPQFGGNAIQTSSTKWLNPDLLPETTRSTELGFEIGLWQNKVNLDVAYYNTNSFDQILSVNTSASSGYLSRLINSGNLNNKGIEIQLNVTPVENRNFRWDVGLNYAKNVSKLDRLDKEGDLTNYTLGSSGGVSVLASVGQRYGALYGRAYQRDEQGNILVGANGLPLVDPSNKVLGHFTPDWTGGITNSFSYKNVQLSFLIDASIGGSIYSGTNRTGDYTGVLEQTLTGRGKEFGGLEYYFLNNNNTSGSKILTGGNVPPNGETVYDDGMIFNGVYADGTLNTTVVSAQQYYKAIYNVDEAYVYSASYVKFREITLGYTFNKNLVKKVGLGAASLSFVGRNLFFIYKKVPNIDPETAFNTGNAQGLESLSLPTVRTVGFNLNLKF